MPNDTPGRVPFSNLPFVYFKDSRSVFLALRKVHRPGVFVDLETLREATAINQHGPLPYGSFVEHTYALQAFGWLDVRRGANGKDEAALTDLGERLTRFPNLDTGALMTEWKAVLDRFMLPVIEHEFHSLPGVELEQRFAILKVPKDRRRARFFRDFFPLYEVLAKGNIETFVELLAATPDTAPRRVHRGSRAVEEPTGFPAASEFAETTEVPAASPTVVIAAPSAQCAPFLPVMVALGSRVEYHRDGRVLISQLP